MMGLVVNGKKKPKHLSSGTLVNGTDRSFCAACGPVTPEASSQSECGFNKRSWNSSACVQRASRFNSVL